MTTIGPRGAHLASATGTPRAVPRTAPGGHQPKHAPRVPFALLLVGLVVGGMCALLALNTASAANELARHDVAGKDSDVAAQLEQVRNEVAASAAPGSLASAAAALGMVPAGAPAFLKVEANGTVVLLGSPAAATAVAAPRPYTPRVVPKATPTKPTPTKPTPTKPTPKKSQRSAATKPATKPAKATSKPPTVAPTPTSTLPGGNR